MASSTSAAIGGGEGGSSGVQVAAEVPFQDICSLMERLSKTSGMDRKKHILAIFIERWREAHARLHTTDAATTVSSSQTPYVHASTTLVPRVPSSARREGRVW